MAGKDREISFDTIASILFEEFDQSASMSPKAFYKIVYFIDKELSRKGYAVDIDHFWYKYGTMAVTKGIGVEVEYSENRSEVLNNTLSDELELDTDIEETVRSATRDVLVDYNRLKTEGLTDLMYEDAPYEFQRRYRALDNVIQSQIRARGKESEDFDRGKIRDGMHYFISSFPENEFPALKNDLYLWYDILSTSLDDMTVPLGNIEDIGELFWTIIMIEIATSHETGVPPNIFADELNIKDPKGLQRYLRRRLCELEDDLLKVEDGSKIAADITDSVMVSQLDFVKI